MSEEKRIEALISLKVKEEEFEPVDFKKCFIQLEANGYTHLACPECGKLMSVMNAYIDDVENYAPTECYNCHAEFGVYFNVVKIVKKVE